MLTGEYLDRFNELNAWGMAAKDADNHERALEAFEVATALAVAHDDQQKSLDAIQPAARALWSLGRYDAASQRLAVAANTAEELGLIDEQGIITSNLGRIAAVQTVSTLPIAEQRQALRAAAIPKFQKAYTILKDNPHLYYRYANAQHGSVVSALAGNRKLAAQLITDGMKVAFRPSDAPYDQERTYKISSGTKRGMVQMLAAAALIPLGGRTPLLANLARNKMVR